MLLTRVFAVKFFIAFCDSACRRVRDARVRGHFYFALLVRSTCDIFLSFVVFLFRRFYACDCDISSYNFVLRNAADC